MRGGILLLAAFVVALHEGPAFAHAAAADAAFCAFSYLEVRATAAATAIAALKQYREANRQR